MSAPLVVSIPHRLGREEALRRLRTGLLRAASSIPVLKVDEERWDGDHMFFRVRALGRADAGHFFIRAITEERLGMKKEALQSYTRFLAASHGNPDQEFQARQRARILEKELNKK